MNELFQRKRLTVKSLMIRTTGIILIPVIWLFLKHVVHVSDRFLPSVASVFGAAKDIEPSVLVHLAYTVSRFGIGFLLGASVGIVLGLWLFKFSWLFELLMPSIQSTRAIPAIAIIPFFI